MGKKIFEYSKMMKDTKGEDFPLMGICQGFQMFAMMVNNDDLSTLTASNVFNMMRPNTWMGDVKTESRMYANFSQQVLDEMAVNPYTFHAHTLVVTMDTYYNSPEL